MERPERNPRDKQRIFDLQRMVESLGHRLDVERNHSRSKSLALQQAASDHAYAEERVVKLTNELGAVGSENNELRNLLEEHSHQLTDQPLVTKADRQKMLETDSELLRAKPTI